MKRPQVLVYYDLLLGIIDEKEYLIFEIEPKPLSIGIITISYETVSLLNIGTLEIKISEKSKLEQGTSNLKITKVVPLTTKPKDFYVKLEISLENKVYL